MAAVTLIEAIQPETLYPLPTFSKLARMGKAALRSARRRGLKVQYQGNVGFVLGRDFIDWLGRNGSDEHRPGDGSTAA